MSATTTTVTAPTGAPKKDLAAIRASGKQVARAAGGTSVQAFFDANKPTLTALLPRHMTADRMLKIALSALRTTPKLMECTIESLFGAIVHCAQLGLEPNTPQGHIYLIPFGNSRKGTTDVQVIIGYKGLIDLARRSGQIVSISARVRYANDPFKLAFGTEDYIQHAPAEDGDRGQVIGVYAVAKLKDGGVQFEYLTLSEVIRIRDGGQGYMAALAVAKRYNKPAKHPWIDHFEEMARKTAIRRLCKYLPMSIELANAVALEDHAEGGKAQNLGAVLDGVEYTVMGDDAPEDDEGGDGGDGGANGGDQVAEQQQQQDPQPTQQQGPSSQQPERGPEQAAARGPEPRQPRQADRAPPAARDEPAGPALPLRGGGQQHEISAEAASRAGQTHAMPADDRWGGME